jgi:16S rRNA (uracil1498-N3)-methyltransferase
MHRFFISEKQFDGQTFILDQKEDVRHLTKALRVTLGEKIEICIEETGEEWVTEVFELASDTVYLKATKKSDVNRESPVKITLYQGLPKADKMELIVQKSTELGIYAVVPVEMDRCVVKLKDKDRQKKQERWQKIANEAAKQSKRSRIPSVSLPIKLKQLKETFSGHDLVIFLYENEEDFSIKEALNSAKGKNIALVVGPEGGFSDVEASLLEEFGCVSTTLGPRILRTETAGLACISIIQYELGDI